MPKYHDGKCGPCVFCKKQGAKYKHFDMFTGETKAALSADDNFSSLSGNSCICYTCFKRCERNKTYLLKKCITKSHKRCDIQSCKHPWHSNFHRTSVTDIEHILEERIRGFQVDEDSTIIGLCRVHYNKLYTMLRATPVCASCGTKQKGSTIINRRGPNQILFTSDQC